MTKIQTAISTLTLASCSLLGACTSRPEPSEGRASTKASAVISTPNTGTACVGRLEPHQWVDSGSLLTAGVSTSRCGFTGTNPPLYFTSLGGQQNHASVTGVNSIRDRSNTGFTVFVRNQVVSTVAANATAWKWYLDWEAFSSDFSSPDVKIGETGATTWIQDGSSGVHVNITTNTNVAPWNFTATPVYQTSLGSAIGGWSAKGITSIYVPTTTGLSVYIYEPGLTVATAQSRGYYIMWKAVRSPSEKQIKTLSRICTGSGPTGAWQTQDASNIFQDVNTGDCGFSLEPAIFTSLGGTSTHWTVMGTTSIFSPTDRGFRVYLNTNVSAADANSSVYNWFVNWTRVDSY